MTGTRIRVSSMEVARPPISTTAIGARVSAPSSIFRASGIMLQIIAPVVMMIGYRGYPGQGRQATDSAARFLEPILDAWGIPHYVVESDATCGRISEAHQQATASSHPVAVLMGKEYNA